MKVFELWKVTIGWLGIVLAGILLTETVQAAGSFRASCVKVDITPEGPVWMHQFGKRQSTGVLHKIYHRVVAMDDGKTEFYLVSSDLIGFSAAFYDSFCQRLEKETGIKQEQLWWTFTHTHAGPSVARPLSSALKTNQDFSGENEEFTENLQTLLIQAIKQARQQLEPAVLGIGYGKSWANINRRSRDVDGRINLGKNPLGPVERTINLIKLQRADGSPLALIANYPIHGTVLGYYANYGIGNTKISGDLQGVVAEYVEEKTGAPLLFIVGAAGNIAPIYTKAVDERRGNLTEFNVLIGEKILEANEGIVSLTRDIVFASEKKLIVETPLRQGFTWPEELSAYRRVSSTGRKEILFPVSFLRINRDIMIWSAPCELFSEIAMKIREESPFAHTFYFGYTNGSFGYLATRQAFAEGGYETEKASPFTPQVEDDLLDGVLTSLNRFHTQLRD
jgi:neutral ceramidase